MTMPASKRFMQSLGKIRRERRIRVLGLVKQQTSVRRENRGKQRRQNLASERYKTAGDFLSGYRRAHRPTYWRYTGCAGLFGRAIGRSPHAGSYLNVCCLCLEQGAADDALS